MGKGRAKAMDSATERAATLELMKAWRARVRAQGAVSRMLLEEDSKQMARTELHVQAMEVFSS